MQDSLGKAKPEELMVVEPVVSVDNVNGKEEGNQDGAEELERDRPLIETESMSAVDLPRPLTASEMAARLGCNNSTLTRQRKRGAIAFKEWSRKQDPDRVAWEHRPNSNNKLPQYFPTEN